MKIRPIFAWYDLWIGRFFQWFLRGWHYGGCKGRVVCPVCNGDGKETCTNPDHGFLWIDSELSRLGCPCCGHDRHHKIPNGGDCDLCAGSGKMPYHQAEEWINWYHSK